MVWAEESGLSFVCLYISIYIYMYTYRGVNKYSFIWVSRLGGTFSWNTRMAAGGHAHAWVTNVWAQDFRVPSLHVYGSLLLGWLCWLWRQLLLLLILNLGDFRRAFYSIPYSSEISALELAWAWRSTACSVDGLFGILIHL